MRILVADPSEATRRALATFLARRGMDVVDVADLAEARRLPDVPWSAVVTESFGDAEETIRAVRRLAPGAPILVFTVAEDRHTEKRVRQAGCAFVRKPSLPGQVAFALGRLVPRYTPPIFPAAARRMSGSGGSSRSARGDDGTRREAAATGE